MVLGICSDSFAAGAPALSRNLEVVKIEKIEIFPNRSLYKNESMSRAVF
jgi:hypothetical protein